jgi:hypothetical protein
MNNQAKTYPISHDLLRQTSNAMLDLANFARYVNTLAEAIKQANQANDASLVSRLLSMLDQLSVDAENISGADLSAEMCRLFQISGEAKQ